MILSNEYADFIFNNVDAILDQEEYNLQCVELAGYRYGIGHYRLENQRLDYGRFPYNIMPKVYGLMDQTSLEETGVIKIQRQPYLSLRGQGVMIGFVDTGIQYENPIFQNEDGTTKIFSIWDQTLQTGSPPNGFLYGREYTSEEINEALQSDVPRELVETTDELGHGTFLAGISAGKENISEDFIGVAPDAQLVVVKLKPMKENLRDFYKISKDAVGFQENDIMMGVKYLITKAREAGKPLVICIGVGTNQGGHNGEGNLSQLLNDLSTYVGNCVVIAGGNEGNAGKHFFMEEENKEEYETVEINVGDNESGFLMELWGNNPNTYSIAIESPSGKLYPRIPVQTTSTVEANFVLDGTKVFVNYGFVEAQTGNQFIALRFQTPARGIWRLRVYSTDTFERSFHIWLPITNFVSEDTFFIRSEPNVTITEPGNARGPITVGAYNHYNNSVWLHSSRGFTRAGVVKPEIVAPGVQVYGPLLNEQFSYQSGSSYSAAFVAGMCAMMLEWGIVKGNDVSLDTILIKNSLIRSATRQSNINYPNESFGYGIVNIFQSFQQLV